MSPILNTNLFLSTHINRIDGKGRVSFPASFRSALAARNSQGVVVFQAPADPAVEGVTVERMQQMGAALESFPPFAAEREAFELAIFGTSQSLQIDFEGRCSLPRALLEAVGIGNEVAFVGRGVTFQIWDPAVLADRKAKAVDALRSGATPFPTLPAGVV
jgi:MraZ protein